MYVHTHTESQLKETVLSEWTDLKTTQMTNTEVFVMIFGY